MNLFTDLLRLARMFVQERCLHRILGDYRWQTEILATLLLRATFKALECIKLCVLARLTELWWHHLHVFHNGIRSAWITSWALLIAARYQHERLVIETSETSLRFGGVISRMVGWFACHALVDPFPVVSTVGGVGWGNQGLLWHTRCTEHY
jgi:hypothetical protein